MQIFTPNTEIDLPCELRDFVNCESFKLSLLKLVLMCGYARKNVAIKKTAESKQVEEQAGGNIEMKNMEEHYSSKQIDRPVC